MDALNSTESRKLTPAQSMKNLEKAVMVADQRLRMKRDTNARAQVFMTIGLAIPLGAYLIYHWFAPSGVMQNYKASTGAYGYYAQSFMYP